MHSHYSIIIICYARSALKQLLNFHSQRHRFRRRRCRLPSVKRDGCFAVTNEAATATLWRKTLISFEFTFDITTNCNFHRLLLIFKVHDGPQCSLTRVAHGRQLSVVQISMKKKLRHVTWAWAYVSTYTSRLALIERAPFLSIEQ